VASGRSRFESLARLAVAYGRHQARRAIPRRKPQPAYDRVMRMYDADGLQPLTAAERELLPAMSRCINCGICAFVAQRLSSGAPGIYTPDLSTAYLRALPRLHDAASEIAEGRDADAELRAAAAACPVGVPLPAVAAIVRRLAGA
jgi:hypothetical protein